MRLGQIDHFGHSVAETYRSPARPRRRRWARPALLVLVVPFVIAAACGSDDDAPAKPSVAACAERMADDMRTVGRANEAAPECAGLTSDQLADAGFAALAQIAGQEN